MTYQAIDVGCEKGLIIEEYIREYLPMWMGDYKVTRLDIDPENKPDILHDILQPVPPELVGKYDYVQFTHVLEHISWRLSVPVFKNVASLVKPGGWFLFAVPSIEFAAREIIRGNFHAGILGLIYGGQDDEYAYHKSGYTRPAVEMLIELIGFKTYSIREAEVIVVIDGKNHHGKQWEVMLRHPEPEPVVEEPAPVVVTKRRRHAKKQTGKD